MDVTSTSAASPATPPNLGVQATAATTQSKQAAATASDFDTFLKLLTTQIRNQDPLEPADATAYTAQLATFSNVEQAVQTNQLLSQMIARLDSQQVTGAADWLGMEIRHSGPVGHVGGSTRLHTAINATADRAELVVVDANGREIARHAIDPDGQTIAWPAEGRGEAVPAGAYELRVESWAGAQALDPTPVSHYATVQEVVMGKEGSELILPGGVRLPIAALESIRRPQG